MSHDNQLIRWTVVGRWIATMGIGLAMALRLCHLPAGACPGPPAAAAAAADRQGAKAAAAAGAPKPLPTIADLAAEAAWRGSETGEEGRPRPRRRPIRVGPPRHPVAQPAHVGRLRHLGRLADCRGLRPGAVPRPAAEQGPAHRSDGRAAGLAGRKGEFDLRHAQRLCSQYPSSAARWSGRCWPRSAGPCRRSSRP